ncbi:MAG: thymidine phosphorylase [Piscinibacter sp.]|uniref:thymidine phosphorylase n=1 Tax=Piscinibacter TaxID=1114981 RepID=UPI000FDF6070|nr:MULTISPECIES: thymidine phosphorylase [Piscinibacter]MCW5663771.1 thymidine phosphorylase [Piscinibacter sp.]
MNQAAGPTHELWTSEPYSDPAVRQAIALARAWTAEASRALVWESTRIVDRHGLDRIPGHRTTPIVAAIVAAAGATMPHFSLRSGTGAWSSADAMATLTGVELDRATAASITSRVGVCVARADAAGVATNVPWSPTADDARLVASALSRRVAAGVGSLLVNVAVGRGTGVPDDDRFHRLQALFRAVGATVGVQVRVARLAGTQPVGLGIGPAPEALDVLAVLRGAAAAPVDLRMHALAEAGQLLEMCGASRPGHGELDAWRLLDSGAAWARFQALCEAQGGMHEPTLAPIAETITAEHAGHVRSLDGAHVRLLAVLAGAPQGAGAGVVLHARIGDRVHRGQSLFTVHAASRQCLTAVTDELRRAPMISVDDVSTATLTEPQDMH